MSMDLNLSKIKLRGVDWFLVFCISLYVVSYVFKPNFTIKALLSFSKTFMGVMPILLAVFVFIFLMNHFIKDGFIAKHLGKDSGIKGWIYTILTGMFVPSPPYIVFPLLGDLKKQGMKTSLIVCFLYSRNLQVAFLPVMALYFGILYTVIVSIFVFMFSIFSGIIVERIVGLEDN